MATDAAAQRRVLDLFDEALEWPEDERDARLAAACGGDAELERRVRAMLAAEDKARQHWPTQPAGLVSLAPESLPPERIGPWKLTRRLGDGGMGAVFLGERDDGLFEQAVAVKLMRPGLFTAAAATQFDSERRLLAKLRHPGIARLFDGGFDAEGRSWIAMERIEGEAITDHVAARRLGPREIVRLLRDICAAVQSAHQALIVHADIKPPNVLVDETGAPKLLDFGIARSLAAEAGPAATGAGLTAAYASPQRRAGERPVPADDIYALGVLLRELLSGETPDEEGRTGQIADPDLAAVADKAAARDPARRYASAAALSDDLGRWLERRPVLARPAPWPRMARLFYVRHPLAVSAAVLAVLGLVGAAVVTSTLYVRAEQQRAQAERRFAEVRSLARFMLFDLSDRLQSVPGGATIRRDAADVGRLYLERLAAVPGASPDLTLETATGYGRVGHALALSSVQSVGGSAQGLRALERAEQMLRGLHAAHPGRDDVTTELARVLAWRGGVLASAEGQAAAAERLTRESLALLDAVLHRRPNDLEAGYARWNAAVGLGDLLSTAGRPELATHLRDTLARGRTLSVTPAFAATRALLESTTEVNLGDAIYDTEGVNAALPLYMHAVSLLERERDRTPAVDVRVADRLVIADWDVSSTYSDMNRHDLALEWADRGAQAARQLTAFDRSARSWRVTGMISLQRASALSRLGRHDEAIAEALASVQMRQRLSAADAHDADLRRAAASSWRPLAETYERAGRRAEACATARRAREAWEVLERDGVMTAFDRTNDLPNIARLLRRCAA